MAPISTKSSGTWVQTWPPITLAEQLKAQAGAGAQAYSEDAEERAREAGAN